jgi:hypothetical protein
MNAVCTKQFTLLVAAFAVTGSVLAAGDPPVAHHPSLKLSTGVFHCDLNRRVEVRQVSDDRRSAIVYWERRNYTMQLVATQTGALRLEDKASGLTWITIPGKSMLLDTKQGKQLANDCRA